MKINGKAVLAILLCVGILGLLVMELKKRPVPVEEFHEEPAISEETVDKARVDQMKFQKMTPSMLRLQWLSSEEGPEQYRIMRKTLAYDNENNSPEEDWQEVGIIPAGDISTEQEIVFDDLLPDDRPRQFLYRVDEEYGDHEIRKGTELLASNVSVCIDPGHYRNASELRCTNTFGYDEGTNMLEVGLLLREFLLKKYGITSRMTREEDDITIGGYTNGELDNYHISLRGESAFGDDLFISLHSNSNLDNANGYMTEEQPIAINKTIIFLNHQAQKTERFYEMANAIGTELTKVNDSYGLGAGGFVEVHSEDALRPWDDSYNDSLEQTGTVCFRDGDNGDDYYGVLRGSSQIGVPGMIVEHGHHSVERVRKLCMQSDLSRKWAQADADGIAKGFGFRTITS